MKFLILDGKRSGYVEGNPSYRGTYRAHPYYCDDLPEDHALNRAFFWFIEEGGELGVVHDVAKAKELVQLYRLHTQELYEVIEVTVGREPPFVSKEFLGFDLSSGFNNSLLWWGLDLRYRGEPSDENFALKSLSDLIESYFRPKLNSNGLFDDYTTAQFCLDCMMGLQTIFPNIFEGTSDFEVVGMYLVR